MLSFIASLFARKALADAAGEIRDGWRWLFSSATHLLEAALLLAVGFGLWERHRLIAVHQQLDRANAALAEVKRQQPIARAAQAAVNHQPAAISAAIAEDSNARTHANRPAIAAAADAYARAHRLGHAADGMCIGADQGAGGRAGLPGTGQPASGGGGTDLHPGMVAISQADFDGFSRNTADLLDLREAIARNVKAGTIRIETKGN